MRTHFALTLMALLSCSYALHSQTFDRTVIASGGGHEDVVGMSVDWTLGELAVETREHADLTLTEGFQQSYLTVESLLDSESDGIEIRIAPNPVRADLSVYLDKIGDTSLKLELFDVNGRALEQLKVDPEINLVNIDMFNYPQGMYFLRIFDVTESKLVRSYKIAKVD